MSGINYSGWSLGRVTQELSTVSFSDFTGTFDEIIEKTNKLKDYYKTGELTGVSDYYIDHPNYKRGVSSNWSDRSTKTLVFDKIYIERRGYGENEYLAVIGERKPLSEEVLVLEAEEKVEAEKRLVSLQCEFERLKKQLGK